MDDGANLTNRQAEVVALVADGLPNKEIAAALGLARGTVRNHLAAAYDRLGLVDGPLVSARILAVRWYLTEGSQEAERGTSEA